MNEDEEFFAWLDGELTGDAEQRVAARVAASPELTARAEQHHRLAAGLRGAFTPVMDAAAPPPRFQAAEVIDFGARATAREQRRRLFGAPQWEAMAATLVLGIVAGQLIGDRSTSPVESRGGMLVASASLDQALDSRLASAPVDDGVRIGLTFRNAAGKICRSFREDGASGLACRDGDDWRIRGLFQGAEGQGGDYRMAAGEDPRLAALIDETIAGEPFDAAQERTAKAKGWR